MSIAYPLGSLFAGRYRLVRLIGAGATGAVYEAVHLETDRRQAIKILHPHLLHTAARERFRFEARVAAHVESAFIVNVIDAGVDPATEAPFLVMELLRGEDLGKRLKRAGPLPAGDAVACLYQAALALDRTHAAGIIHRDIKPANLFLSEQEGGALRLMVLDFGVAKLATEASSAAGTIAAGTPSYMAPEQIKNGPVSAATDVYALGMVAYTLLVGEAYWADEVRSSGSLLAFALTAARGPQEAPSIRAARRGAALPRAFDAWFATATEADPELRVAKATTAVRALAGALGLPQPDGLLPALDLTLAPAPPGETDAEPRVEEDRPGSSNAWAGAEGGATLSRTGIGVSRGVLTSRAPLSTGAGAGLGRRRWLVGVGATLAGAAAAAYFVRSRPKDVKAAPVLQHRQITFTGDVQAFALSPSGDEVAYLTPRALQITGLGASEPRVVADDIDWASPLSFLDWPGGGADLLAARLPDPTFYAFPLRGGPRRPVLAFPQWSSMAFSPDGTEAALVPPGEARIDIIAVAGGGSRRSIPLNLPSAVIDIEWSRFAPWLLVQTVGEGKNAIRAVSIDGAAQNLLLETPNLVSLPRWSPRRDAIYYRQAGELMKLPVDPQAARPVGSPVTAVARLEASSFAFASDGKRLFYLRSLQHADFWRVPLVSPSGPAGKPERITPGSARRGAISVSPDGARLAFAQIDTMTRILVLPLAGGSAQQIAAFDARTTFPMGTAWSPDGASVAFTTITADWSTTLWQAREGHPEPTRLPVSDMHPLGEFAWSVRGLIAYWTADGARLCLFDPASGQGRTLLSGLSPPVTGPRFSPDGTALSVSLERGGHREIFRVDVETGELRQLDAGDLLPVGFSADGANVYAVKAAGIEEIAVVPVTGRARSSVALPLHRGARRVVTVPGGTSLVCSVVEEESDVWLCEDSDPSRALW